MSPPHSPSEASPLLGQQISHVQDATTANGSIVREDDEEEENGPLLAEEPSTKELLAIICPVWLGTFFAALDSTIVATLTEPISSSFGSLSLLSWVATGYLIANSACQPLSGKLTDIYGRKAGLIFSNIVFGAGCLIIGLANSAGMVIAGRVVSGVGGGGLNAIATFVTSDLVPLRKRGAWQGYNNIIFGLGMGLGGLFGGWINDTIGWRWAFLIQVPFVMVSAVMIFFLLNIPVQESSRPSLARIDFLGSVMIVISLVLLLLGLNTGGNQLPWQHPLIIASLLLAGVFFGIFIYVEDRVAVEPIIPVRLVAHRTVLSACLANWFGTMSQFLALYYVPIYLQVRGLSSTQAGLRVLPFSAALSVGSVGVGWIMRHTGRYYLLNGICMTFLVGGSALLCTFDLNTPMWATYLYNVPQGIGYAGMLTITLVAMISAVDHKDQAVITAASYAFRSTGSTIGITIASAVFQNILAMQLMAKYGDRDAVERVKNDLRELDHLPKGWDRETVLAFYMQALRGAFVAGLGLAVIAMVCSLFMREHVLHKNLARK